MGLRIQLSLFSRFNNPTCGQATGVGSKELKEMGLFNYVGFVGFAMIIMSEMFAAVRWVVTEKTLKKSGLQSVDTVLYMSPGATLSLVWPAAAIESDALYDSFLGPDRIELSDSISLNSFIFSEE